MDSHVSYSASQFVKRLENVYRHQEEREEFLQSVCSPTKHHVTLCVCKLEDDDDIEIVKQVGTNKNQVTYYAHGITGTPNHVLSDGAHLCGLAPWQLCSKETSQRGDNVSNLSEPGIEPKVSHTDSRLFRFR